MKKNICMACGKKFKNRFKIVGDILFMFLLIALGLGIGILLPAYCVKHFGNLGFLGFLPIFIFLFIIIYRGRLENEN